ncbi:MAG: Cysteine-rich small domain protein [Candidatus Izimaplasma bacterium HR2]|nr:MAG: Cysteine-rich small domain protein [Candidatus Izimaplasma bacterium HR2]
MKEKNSYKYFCNKECEYFPCHDLPVDNFNCLFCFCPLYEFSDCGGTYKMIKLKNGKEIKSCIDCTVPHRKENYDYIMKILTEHRF